jgi:hypothetical protein
MKGGVNHGEKQNTTYKKPYELRVLDAVFAGNLIYPDRHPDNQVPDDIIFSCVGRIHMGRDNNDPSCVARTKLLGLYARTV